MIAHDARKSASGRRTAGALTQVGTEVSINLGSALAGLAIPIVGATLVVAVRQLVMVLAVGPFYRPSRASFTWPRLYPAILLGIDLAIMNLTFYQAVHLLGLGIAATIEFLGPLALALALSRRILDVICVAVAAIGVLALTGIDGSINVWGIVLALIAAAAWAGYILLTRRVALTLPGLEGLTVASAVSLVIIAPLALLTLETGRITWPVIALLLSIGVLSSALPYSLDTYILRRITARLYAIITSFGPVVAALFGWLLLAEALSLVQIAAIVLVCAAAATAIATQRDMPTAPLAEASPHIT